MPDTLDPELLQRFVQGDEAAFESLFRQFGAEVYGWVLRILLATMRRRRMPWSKPSGARIEAVPDSTPRAVLALGSAGLRPNAALDQLKKAAHVTTRIAADGGARSTTEPVQYDLRDALRIAFGRLPPRLAAVAALALIEQQSYADIAEALDLPIGTVKSRVFRATRLLREELARLGFLT